MGGWGYSRLVVVAADLVGLFARLSCVSTFSINSGR